MLIVFLNGVSFVPVPVLHKDEKISGRKHIYLPHSQTAIYDSEVKLFLKQRISCQLGRGWTHLFDLNAIDVIINFYEKYSTSQSDMMMPTKILDHVSDAYVACIGLLGHLFGNKRSFCQKCQIISCHIRKLLAHDRWPTPNGNPVYYSIIMWFFILA